MGENLVFVRVNNLWNPRIAPRAGEHVFNGGIYRDVAVLVTDPFILPGMEPGLSRLKCRKKVLQ